MEEKKFNISNLDQTQIFGYKNENLDIIKKSYSKLKIVLRGEILKVIGDESSIKDFSTLWKKINSHYVKFNHLSQGTLKSMLENKYVLDNIDFNSKNILLYGNRGRVIRSRTPNQYKMVKSIEKDDLLFAIGPAGSGKTYTAVAIAVKALKEKEVKKIILTRPAVEAGENLGFLPGDLQDKIDPYLQPIYDALEDMIPIQKMKKYIENKTIDIAPLAYMRGRTLKNAFILLDEAQNTTKSQLKMFLTRLGENSKMIVTGDISQVDLRKDQSSGLIDAKEKLKDVNGIGFTLLDSSDVLRHRLVKKILDKYKR